MSAADILQFEDLQELEPDTQIKQMVQGFQQVLNNIERSQSKLKKESAINKHKNILISEKSLYYPYLKRVVSETAEYFNIQFEEVTYKQVTKYRLEMSKKHYISRRGVYSRLDRLTRIDNYRNHNWITVRNKFWSEMEKRTGLKSEHIWAESQIIAANFNEVSAQPDFRDAMNLNAEYMRSAIDIILEWEKEYNINEDESFKAHSQKLSSIYSSRYFPYSADDYEYMNWFDQMVLEYRRIFGYETAEEATEFIFDYAQERLNTKPFWEKKSMPRNFDKKSQVVKFTESMIMNMHNILSDKTLRDLFYKRVSINVYDMW